MKINVSNRDIEFVNKPDLSDISVGYIDNKSTEDYVDFIIDENFVSTSSERVMPYQKISSPSTLFFNGDGEVIKDIELKRLGNAWIYEPSNSTEYTPTRFECSAIIKRALTFTENKTYNLKICAGDTSAELDLCTQLINIFGNANKRSLCPSNIIVNSNKTEPESLLEYSVANSDFLFLESSDGVTMPIEDLDIDEIISSNTNVWIFADDFEGFTDAPVTDSESESYTPIYLEGRLNNFYTKKARTAKLDRIIKLSEIPSEYDDFSAEIVYDDILILSKSEKGSIVIAPSEFLENLSDNVSVLYDVLMYIYLKSYVKTKTISSWITNEPINKRAYSNFELNRYHEKITVRDMLDADTENENYSILRVNTDNEGISLVDMSSDKELFFRKNESATKDPVKDPEEISFLTTKQTVLNYRQEDVFMSELPAKLSYSYVDDELCVSVEPMISSTRRIIIPETVSLRVLATNRKYYVCVSQVEPEQISDVKLVDAETYSLTNDGIKIAEVIPGTSYDTKMYDIRVKGGGLPESFEDDYDLLDIGNPYGRPYRKGSTLIFRLPTQLEQYKDKIESEVEKHIIASDVPVFIYDKETE